MPSESSIPNTPTPQASGSTENTGSDGPVSSAQKGAATVRRHKQEQRAESLRLIRAQISDGTLVVRQMTVAERASASKRPAGRSRKRKHV
jgi:hypothetical protein